MKRFFLLTFAALIVAWVGQGVRSAAGPSVPSKLTLPHVLDVKGQLKSGERFEKTMPLKAQRIYSVSVALENPSKLGARDAVRVTVRDSQCEVVSKTLHVGDPDVYFLMRSSADGDGQVTLRGDSASFQAQVREWSTTNFSAIVETEPNNRYQDANEMALEKTALPLPATPILCSQWDRNLRSLPYAIRNTQYAIRNTMTGSSSLTTMRNLASFISHSTSSTAKCQWILPFTARKRAALLSGNRAATP